MESGKRRILGPKWFVERLDGISERSETLLVFVAQTGEVAEMSKSGRKQVEVVSIDADEVGEACGLFCELIRTVLAELSLWTCTRAISAVHVPYVLQ